MWRSRLVAGLLGFSLGCLVHQAFVPAKPDHANVAAAVGLRGPTADVWGGVAAGTASPRPDGMDDTKDWKCVSMYRGSPRDPRLDGPSASQRGQDLTIADIFNHKVGGTFLDLASNDAIRLSNSMLLEQKYNWTGVCVEANLDYAQGYVHRTCRLVQAVVGPKEGVRVEFTKRGTMGGIIGFDNKDAGKNAAQSPLQPHYTVSVAKVLRDFKMPTTIDYLSLDIEGAEAWAFETFPWDVYTFLTATVERPGADLTRMMEDNGYFYLCDHGGFGDQLWVHKSLPNFAGVYEKYAGRRQCSVPRNSKPA